MMKKLMKLQLENQVELLSDDEMKHIQRGYAGGSDCFATTKIEACKNKSENDSCCWLYDGTPSYGKCVWNHYQYKTLYCSDLNK